MQKTKNSIPECAPHISMDNIATNPFNVIKSQLKGFVVGQINIVSLTKYIDQLRVYLQNQLFHVIGANETRLNETIGDGNVVLNGYDILRNDRNREGGGVALYVKTCLNSLVRDDLIPDGLEAICAQIKRPKSKPLFIATCYRQ